MNEVPLATVFGALSAKYETTSLVEVYVLSPTASVGRVAWGFYRAPTRAGMVSLAVAVITPNK